VQVVGHGYIFDVPRQLISFQDIQIQLIPAHFPSPNVNSSLNLLHTQEFGRIGLKVKKKNYLGTGAWWGQGYRDAMWLPLQPP